MRKLRSWKVRRPEDIFSVCCAILFFFTLACVIFFCVSLGFTSGEGLGYRPGIQSHA
uniref:Uncharacterized protein n=1 Tax=Leviviridae sp. TaxID=2027243 RepID=A0A514CYR0_9VIRU|nr:MAG: hypothetical protein H2RhizoLitter491576_000002 [Leviviridae sp.]